MTPEGNEKLMKWLDDKEWKLKPGAPDEIVKLFEELNAEIEKAHNGQLPD